MTIQTVSRAVKAKKPAIIKERGAPRYVILDWDTYCEWEKTREDMEDAARLNEALADPGNQRRVKLSNL